MKTIQMIHHGREVTAVAGVAGLNTEHCLCYGCARFQPGKSNCPIAQAVYDNCVKFSIVTPVYECPDFVGKNSRSYPPPLHLESDSNGEA